MCSQLQLAIPPPLRPLWLSFTSRFSHHGIVQHGTKVSLIWSIDSNIHLISVRKIYSSIIADLPPLPSIFPVKLWKAPCPLKTILFSWLLFFDMNLTWDVSQRKGWHGPGRCVLCLQENESNSHMFLQCPAAQAIWNELSSLLSFPHCLFSSVQDAFLWWADQSSDRQALFCLTCWNIWTWRNRRIFQASCLPLFSILPFIMGSMPSQI